MPLGPIDPQRPAEWLSVAVLDLEKVGISLSLTGIPWMRGESSRGLVNCVQTNRDDVENEADFELGSAVPPRGGGWCPESMA